MRALSECSSGFLFEGFDELDQIAFVRRRCRQNMNVVRHEAIGVNEKSAGGGVFSQAACQPRSQGRVRSEAPALMKTERNEIEISAAIPQGREPDIFALELSGSGHGPSVPR